MKMVIVTLVSLLATGESVYLCRSRSATQESSSKKLSSLTELMDYDISSFSDMVVQEHLH